MSCTLRNGRCSALSLRFVSDGQLRMHIESGTCRYPWRNGKCTNIPPCPCPHACVDHGIAQIPLLRRGRPRLPLGAPKRVRNCRGERTNARAEKGVFRDNRGRERKLRSTPAQQRKRFAALAAELVPELVAGSRYAETGFRGMRNYTPTTIQRSRSLRTGAKEVYIGALVAVFSAVTTLACGAKDCCGCEPPCEPGKHADSWACDAARLMDDKWYNPQREHSDMLMCLLVAFAEMYRASSRGSDFRRMSVALLRHAGSIGSTKISLDRWNAAFLVAAGDAHVPFKIGEYSWTKGAKDAIAINAQFDIDRTVFTRGPGMTGDTESQRDGAAGQLAAEGGYDVSDAMIGVMAVGMPAGGKRQRDGEGSVSSSGAQRGRSAAKRGR